MLGLVQEVAAGAGTFGRYELSERIARGGMATVYRARLTGPEGFVRWYAVKVIHPHLADEPRMVQMFLREARLLARLSHPNVCSVVDFGHAHDSHYLVLEYLEGATLAQLLGSRARREPLPLALAVRVVADAARGLHAAHELRGADGRNAGVVHRDVSPQNLFVTDAGVTKVLDFGIARSDDEASLTRTGDLKGKLEYMAPEQLGRQAIDRRVDVFALGVVLWEASTGRRLFKRGSEPETILAITQESAPRPSLPSGAYPPELESIVMRALDRDPAARFPTAGAMADALEAFLHRAGVDRSVARLAELMRSRAEAASTPLDTSVPEPPPTTLEASIEQPDTALRTRTAVSRRSRANGVLALTVVGVLGSLASLGVVLARHRPRVAPPVATRPALRANAPTAPPPPLAAPAPPPASVTVATPVAAPLAPETPRAAPPRARTRVVAPAPRITASRTTESVTGFLDLMALPTAARVYDGSRLLGVTPLVHLALPAGTHTLQLTPESGGSSRDVVVTIQPSELTRRVVRW